MSYAEILDRDNVAMSRALENVMNVCKRHCRIVNVKPKTKPAAPAVGWWKGTAPKRSYWNKF